MPVKDYYLLLRLKPGADLKMIKKAYRMMAMEYHPDKTGNDVAQNAYFSDIREAYEILTDPEKREKYHYERWLEKAMGHSIPQAHSAPELLKHFISIEQFLSGTDQFRMDVNFLEKYLMNLLSRDKISIIAESPDLELKRACIQVAIKLSEMLSTKGMEQIFNLFESLLQEEPSFKMEWEMLIEKKRKQQLRDHWKIPIILLITLLLCLLMFALT